MRPNKLLFKDVSAFLALGFGTGLYPHAPGTLGTLVALPIFYLTLLLPTNISYIFAVALFFIGIYVSNHTSQILKIKDPSCIVIDEIVAFLIILMFIEPNLKDIFIAFILFRLFDIWKPFPINLLDSKLKGGFGIMIDDIGAAIYTLIIYNVINYYV